MDIAAPLRRHYFRRFRARVWTRALASVAFAAFLAPGFADAGETIPVPPPAPRPNTPGVAKSPGAAYDGAAPFSGAARGHILSRIPPDAPVAVIPADAQYRPAGRSANEVPEDFTVVPDYVLPCPVCASPVREVLLLAPGSAPDAPDAPKVPDGRWELASPDLDIDLCPYPKGAIRFQADVTQCPHCGFSARQEDFRREQPAEVKRWVAQKITPDFRLALLRIVGESPPPPGRPFPEDLQRRLDDAFSLQGNIPDILRLEAALAYYTFVEAPLPVRAKMAQLAAWGYRRAQNELPEGAFMLEGLRPLLSAHEKETPPDADVDQQLAALGKILRDVRDDGRPRFGWYQRQCAGFVVAGLYDRLGYLGWAKGALRMIEEDAMRVADPITRDPLWAELDPALSPAEREQQIRDRRTALVMVSRARQNQIDLEAARLELAAKLQAEMLSAAAVQYPWHDLPARMFLVGEWRRRAQDFARADLWLAGAEALREFVRREGEGVVDVPGLEIFARRQRERLRQYTAGLPDIDLAAAPAADREEIARLSDYFAARRQVALIALEEPPGGEPAAPAPATRP